MPYAAKKAKACAIGRQVSPVVGGHRSPACVGEFERSRGSGGANSYSAWIAAAAGSHIQQVAVVIVREKEALPVIHAEVHVPAVQRDIACVLEEDLPRVSRAQICVDHNRRLAFQSSWDMDGTQ